MPVNFHQMSNNEVFKLRQARWWARTNLLFLVQNVLGYNDANYGAGQGVQPDVHGPLIDHLQKFPLPPVDRWNEFDRLDGKRWVYSPFRELYDLEGPRKRLILDSRGHLKSTLNCIAHSVQWIINYPDVAIVVFMSTDTKSQSMLREIRRHFVANPIFRDLFPEHCPKKTTGDWGTRTEIFTEARSPHRTAREGSVTTGALEKGMAGYHFDVEKFSDIVDVTNVITREQIISVYENFQMAHNLLVRPTGWIDLEGTIYDLSDTHMKVIEKEKERVKKGKPKQWSVYIRGCYKKDVPGGQKFTVEELDSPDLLDDKDHPIPWWPQRWSYEELEKKRFDNPFIFSCQQRLNPLGDESQRPFPIRDGKHPEWISTKNFRNVPISFYTVTCDTADTQNARSKYTAITVVGWSHSGQAYLRDVRHGRFMPDEIIFHLFDVNSTYRPLNMKIEETAFVRGLMPMIRHAEQTGELKYRDKRIPCRGVNLPLEMIKRDNDITKQERILNTLQPWYMSGKLRFVRDEEELPNWWEHLMYELSRFPFYEYNDIIDALADQFQGREYFGRTFDRDGYTKTEEGWRQAETARVFRAVQNEQFNKLLGLNDDGDYVTPVPQAGFYDRTGGL